MSGKAAGLGGNGTLVGAAANLTVAGITERSGIAFQFITFTLYDLPMLVRLDCHLPRLRLVALLLADTSPDALSRQVWPPFTSGALPFRLPLVDTGR
jgi:hypothetical protein